MQLKKKHVGILMGGPSAEHEVSLISAYNVIRALDPKRYEVVPIGIDKSGQWWALPKIDFVLHPQDPLQVTLAETKTPVLLRPGAGRNSVGRWDAQKGFEAFELDVIFPVLHGTLGEDGAIQGLLKSLDMPFVGADVLGAAVAMDKDVMKRLLRDAAIPVPKFLVLQKHELPEYSFERMVEALGLPFFVKPANLGSSVGISKVKESADYLKAMNLAFEYDVKVIVEEGITGRELECAVLGNQHPRASLPGELIPHHEFYSYEAKYLDKEGASFQIPVTLTATLQAELQTMAIHAYKVLCCEGMARVDFFLKDTGELLLNEINTIPGFTPISMYPKLWSVSGIAYPDLLERLIALALERYALEKAFNTQREEVSA